MIEPVLVGTGGAIGAVGRYAVGQWVEAGRIPVGTLAVNALGSFLLGLVLAAGASDETVLLVGVGACGAFTTYSSFSFETVRLWEDGDRLDAALYAGGTLAVCLGAVGAATLLASVLVG